MHENISSAAVLDALPVAVALVHANSQEILYVNSFFSINIMKKEMAEGTNFMKELLKDQGIYKIETNLSLLQTETQQRLNTVHVGVLSTLCLHGEEGFPLHKPVDWTISIVDGNPEQLLFTGVPERLQELEQTDSEENILTTNEFVDFFQKAPIALHWLSGVSKDTYILLYF